MMTTTCSMGFVIWETCVWLDDSKVYWRWHERWRRGLKMKFLMKIRRRRKNEIISIHSCCCVIIQFMCTKLTFFYAFYWMFLHCEQKNLFLKFNFFIYTKMLMMQVSTLNFRKYIPRKFLCLVYEWNYFEEKFELWLLNYSKSLWQENIHDKKKNIFSKIYKFLS